MPINCLSQLDACHDRITRNFPAAGFDNRGRRCRGIGHRRGSGHRHIDVRAGGQGVAENRKVPRHPEGGATLRKLCTVRGPIILQNGRWNCCRARLVHGLREEASIKSNIDCDGLAGPFSPLPWIESTFNKILLVNVAYFFDSNGQDIAEVYRVLRLGGRVVLYVTSRETMSKWPFSGPETHRIYDRSELLDLLEGAGFQRSDIKDLKLPLGIKGLLATAAK